MSGKKKLLMALLTILLLGTIGAGIAWNRENYVMVDLRFYPRHQQSLDLRGKKITPEHYDNVKAKLPGREILWEVPFQDTRLPSDAKTVTVTALSEADVARLAYLTELETVQAEGCEDYESLLLLEAGRPELDIRYSVTLGDNRFSRDAREIRVNQVTIAQVNRLDCLKELKSVICTGGETSAAVALREACAQRGIGYSVAVGDQVLGQEVKELTLEETTLEETFLLASLPDLKKVHLICPKLTAENALAFAENCPDKQITWEVEVCGVRCGSGEEELDLSGAKLQNLAEVDKAISWFPKLKTVFLGKSTLDNETLAQWREEKREQYKLVWTVQLGDKLTARTDDTSFMPVREHVYYFNDQEAYNLRYCEDMVCIDIGHMSIHNIEFVEYMPNLTYLILAHSQLQYIDPISSCKNLKFLELDWSPLRDLSPLVGCTALEDLNLGNTFASFEPIKQMTWLKNLWVINCSGGTAYQMSQALPNTKVQGAGSATVDSGWRDLPNYYAMRDELGMHYMSW